MILFKRSFIVLRFLNTRHNVTLRYLFFLLGWVSVFVSSGKIVLANEVAEKFRRGFFKVAGRKVP